MAILRLAEREGIGVDRMVGDMLAVGRPEPEISEIDGPYVRVALVGGEPDRQIVAFLSALDPARTAVDVDALLLIDHLGRHGWVDVETATPVLQRPAAETDAAIGRLAGVRIDGGAVIMRIGGVPPDRPPAYRFTDAARARLAGRIGHLSTPIGRTAMILAWANARGRVSTTEVADMTGVSVPYAGTLLTALEEDGFLDRGRANRRGRGFYYVPAALDSST